MKELNNPSATRTGFTIVELLIVVVVIAILVAVTIVAYNGITAKANDSARLTDASAIEKAIQLRHVEHGTSLPVSSQNYPSYTREGVLGLYDLQSLAERVVVVNYDEVSPPDFDRQKIYLNLYIACIGNQSGEHCSMPWTISSVGYAHWSNTENAWLHMEMVFNNGSGEIHKYDRPATDGPFSMGNIAN